MIKKTQVLEKLKEYLLKESRAINLHSIGRLGTIIGENKVSLQRLEVNCTISHKIISSEYSLRAGQSNGSAHPWLLPEKNHPLLLHMPSKVAFQALNNSINSPALNQTKIKYSNRKLSFCSVKRMLHKEKLLLCTFLIPVNIPNQELPALYVTLGGDSYSTVSK